MTIPRLPWRALTLAGMFLASVAIAQTPPPPPVPAGGAPDGAQELTRGPIHEAFGQPTAFNPQAGPIAPKAPPEAIEELPPEQKPEGENVAWIPGYWHWDDEGKTFIWASGFWRSIPYARTWVPGYWNQVDAGYQWVGGYWAAERATEVEYLPQPPESVESGPTTEATVEGQMWIPGTWMWQDTRYVWRPGFWAAGNPDWVWVPAHYVWTPSGYVFIDGYWDYPLFNRGLLFAPVAFADVRPGFVYRPAVVLDTRLLVISLFARPQYNHYYFGDYYADTYVRSGIYPWFAFHSSRYGYDPLYAHTNFVYSRRDPAWGREVRDAYFYRREHEAARPPRTFRQYTDWARRAQGEDAQRIALAAPITEVARNRDFPTRLERVDERQTELIKKQAIQIRQFRDERVKIEKEAAKDLRPGTTTKGATTVNRTAPAKVRLPEAPRLGPPATTKSPEVGTAPRTTEPKRTGTPTGPSVTPPESPRAPVVPSPKDRPEPKPGGKARPALPDPEDLLRPDPGAKRPAPKGRVGELPPPGSRTLPPTGKDLPPTGKDLPPSKKDRPGIDIPDRPDLPPVRKDRPKVDIPDRPDPPARKDRPKVDGPDRPNLPPTAVPKKDLPPPAKAPPRDLPPPKKDKDRDKKDKDGG
jgi:WXXGXW repeat (2 copies)